MYEKWEQVFKEDAPTFQQEVRVAEAALESLKLQSRELLRKAVEVHLTQNVMWYEFIPDDSKFIPHPIPSEKVIQTDVVRDYLEYMLSPDNIKTYWQQFESEGDANKVDSPHKRPSFKEADCK